MNLQQHRTLALISAILLSLPAAPGAARAVGEHAGGHGTDIGSPASPSEADRTITVVMKDSYYEPSRVTVREGETVRFKVENAGQLVHEFGLGTTAMHKAHRKEMTKMVELGALQADQIDRKAMQGDGHGEGMAHDDPNSVLLEPGETKELTWTFDTDAELQFACNVPGHYDAGMVGEVEIRGDER